MTTLAIRATLAARRFAVAANRQLPELVDIEQQSGTGGTSSATPSWTAVVEDWPCFARPTKEAPGARPNPMGTGAPSYAYEMIGPAVTVDGSKVTAIAVTKEMRLRKKARGAEPERMFSITDIAIVSGVQLKILATLND